MITLFQFPRMWNVDNPSPFCMKVETYLRLTRTPYEVKVVGNPTRAPKKKLPFIKDGERVVPDSSFIVEYLIEKNGDKLDSHLSTEQKAVSAAIRKFFEVPLVLFGIYQRWYDRDFWPQTREAFFSAVPVVIRKPVAEFFRRGMVGAVKAAAWHRWSRDEVYGMLARDLQIASDLLGTKPFYMGDKPTSVDASAYAVLANFIRIPLHNRAQELAKRHQNLVDYVDRMETHLTAVS